MIQRKQEKKIKGVRKKAREELIERLMLKYPTWFEGKTDKQIKDLISAFKSLKVPDEEFPNFCIQYESGYGIFYTNFIKGENNAKNN